MSEKIWKHFRCGMCFKNWKEEQISKNLYCDAEVEHTLCSFCSKQRTPLETLNRMVEVMPTASPADFPEFIKRLMQHVVLKEYT